MNRLTRRALWGALGFALAAGGFSAGALADETCQSPYMAKIVGQEDFVYVWTLGVEGLGDGQDKLVTIDVNPQSPDYGKVVHTLSVGGRNEAHHSGFTDDRRYLWAGGLDTSKIFIFDVHSDPAKPRLVRVIDDFVARSGGVVGPHTTYALPGRMMLTGLSNNRDHGGRTALVEYSNDGEYLATHWMPTDEDLRGAVKAGKYADGYGQPTHDWCVTTTALTSKIWLIYEDDQGEWQARAVADIGDPAKVPLPVDISIAADDSVLWVNTFMDGKTRLFDLSDPMHPKQIYERPIGRQVNMASESWDGKRIYYTSSLLANWDKKGEDNEQFFKAFEWDGKELQPKFAIDFTAARLGRPHQMRFGAYSLYAKAPPQTDGGKLASLAE